MSTTMPELVRVYIDETGGVMGTKTSDRFYIATAILVFEGTEHLLAEGIRKVRDRYISGAPLKSSRIGGRNKLRLACLTELCRLPFVYIALIVDKRRLSDGSGLKYRKSRYKFLHDRLNQYLLHNLLPVEIVIDQYGSEEFEESCRAYFEKKNQTRFFGRTEFKFVKDEDVPGVQLADFIGGTLLQCVDPVKRSEFYDQYRPLLQTKESLLAFFPSGFIDSPGSIPPGANPDAEALRRLLNNKACSFLERHENDVDEKKKMQVYTLRRLFDASSFESEDRRSIFSDQLIQELKEQEFQVSPRSFTGEVIGGLRREGVIISGSSTGYKLALTLDDIREYLQHDKSIILPMLQKLAMAQRTTREGINFDILQDPQYAVLRKLVGSMETHDLEAFGTEPEPDVEKIEFMKDS